jgi:WhiB family transcriptional regulator, redox-sensing transcriptional regulator
VSAEQHWSAYGVCGEACPDDLFVEGAAQRSAREVCFECPVRMECLIDSLDNHITFGVWGGMTERERRALMRRFPGVVSWREVLEATPELAGAADARLNC